MKTTYILGIDAAKHKIRVALSGAQEERFLFEKDLPVSAAGLRELLARLEGQSKEPERFLVLIEATGVLHLHWAAALAKAGYAVAVINPLMARRPPWRTPSGTTRPIQSMRAVCVVLERSMEKNFWPIIALV
jgi:transposase